jgi:uncharacterized phosphosugar-binding protein
MFAKQYLETLQGLIERAINEQMAVIEMAGKRVAESVAQGGILHIFGVGHSHILAEEGFYRAGGLAAVNPILEPSLMLHSGARKSMQLENINGLGAILFRYHELKKEDILLVVSNSGVSRVPIELASLAKEKGIYTIAITSVKYSEQIKGDKQALYEIVDLVIDNFGEPGDALIQIPGLPQRVGPSSTVIGAALLNAVIVAAVAELQAMGVLPPVYISGHLPGADEHNSALVRKYALRIRAL